MSKVLCFMFLFSISALSISAFAQTKTSAPTEITPPDTTQTPMATEPVLIAPPKPLSTSVVRALSSYTGNIHFSPISTWVPLKYGLSLGSILNEKWTVEAELTQKTFSAGLFNVDFGHISDSRYGVQARLYPSNGSFNFIMGLFRNELAFELGNSLINRIPNIPSTTVFKVHALGPQLGLGNRWQWKMGVTFGVDWFVMYYPMFDKQADDDIIKAVTNQNDKDDLNGAVAFFRDKPQFDLFKLTLGYTF
jgi:hypothetical protein